MGRKIFLVIMSIVLVAGCSQMVGKRAKLIEMPKAIEGASPVGTSACADCHEDYVGERTNVHMRLASFEVTGGLTRGCEGCHGPGSLHVEGDGDVSKIMRFGKDGLEPEEVAGVCLGCHQNAPTLHWAGSVHAEEDVTCTDCHKIHGNPNKDLLKGKSEFELCSSCHQDIKAKTFMMSRHPVREGKMHCSDCHEPHGTGNLVPGMIKTDERLNDLCLKCHTRYQGPFVFEHDPVVEDCTYCHEPHGTVANNLLKQNEPFLCLQCHEAHFHATRLSSPAGTYTLPPNVQDPYTGEKPPTVDIADHSWQRAFLTKCTQCHQNVHGSDLPSQTAPGQGKMFTR